MRPAVIWAPNMSSGYREQGVFSTSRANNNVGILGNSVGNGRHTTAKFPTQHGYVGSPLVLWKAQRFPCSDQGLKWEMQVLIVEVSPTRT